jgi:uncharacterized protein (DUF433 family)
MDAYMNKIEINPKILMGKPVFKGTRIPLYVISDLIAEGMTNNEITNLYPDLNKDDIKSAIQFASDSARHIAEIELETAHSISMPHIDFSLQTLFMPLPMAGIVKQH